MQIQHYFGNDLTLTPAGDLVYSNEPQLTQQAIIRRLLTNTGTYIWHPTYGVGIGKYVGQNASAEALDEIQNLITSQINSESTVAANPPPQVTLTPMNGEYLQCDILYFDALSKNPQTISFNLNSSGITVNTAQSQ